MNGCANTKRVKMVGFSESMLEAIEKWRAKQRPIPNVSDAIRQLIEMGLKASRGTKD
jgi:hypothetical protein